MQWCGSTTNLKIMYTCMCTVNAMHSARVHLNRSVQSAIILKGRGIKRKGGVTDQHDILYTENNQDMCKKKMDQRQKWGYDPRILASTAAVCA